MINSQVLRNWYKLGDRILIVFFLIAMVVWFLLGDRENAGSP